MSFIAEHFLGNIVNFVVVLLLGIIGVFLKNFSIFYFFYF